MRASDCLQASNTELWEARICTGTKSDVEIVNIIKFISRYTCTEDLDSIKCVLK